VIDGHHYCGNLIRHEKKSRSEGRLQKRSVIR
jgi:hypothetical protein